MADNLLPVADTAKEYYQVKKKDGSTVTKLRDELTPSEVYAVDENNGKVKYADYPQFTVNNGKVKVTGSSQYINSDIVDSTAKLIQDYYKGYDLSNSQVAENFQKTLDEVNKRVKSQLQYQEYADFLDKTGFSDAAYRNYSLAVQESDPKNTTNLLKSKKKFYGLKKDGTLTDEPMTPEQWIAYWKENYTPEERAQLWMDGAEAIARASKGGTDDDLYAALPYILMGHTETRNIPSAILNMINPFNGMDVNEDLAKASVVTPIYGFDDTNDLSVFTQAFIRQLGMRGLEIASDIATFDNPWSELGATSGGQYFGIPDWDDSNLEELTRDEYQDLADAARAAVRAGFDTYEKMEKEYGAETAKKLWTVYSFSKTDPNAVGGGRVLDTIRNEKGEVVAEEGDYPGYKTYQDFQSRLAKWREGRGGFETWSQSAIDDMNKYVSQMSVYSPNFATAGVVAGQIASFIAEQAALSLVSGGALSAPNVAARVSKLFNVGAARALEATKIGQKVASMVPSLAKAINAMAVSTSATALGANGYRLGKAALDGATRASKVLYTLGSIGNWAIREVGEDALRGLVDDAVMKNSFDSQGNLDPTKLVENVYMNAVMLGLAKGAKFTLGGLGSVIDAAGAKNIDGVELNTTQRHQLNLFQKALDDQHNRVQFRGWDADGHPEITVNGKAKVLDQITPSGETAEAIQEVTGVAAPTAARTLENILADENVPEATKQKITEILEQKRVADEANGGAVENWKEEIKTKIQESLDDDEIRQAFPDGTIKIGDDTIKIDTKEFTSGDVNRVTGKEFASMDEAIEGLKNARTTSNFASAINGILRQSIDFAKNFKNAVQKFADAHNMTVRDVMIAVRESRLAGEETIPGLKELWETHWKPVQERLLDVQEAITGIRPASHDFYFRDMLEGTFNPSASGAWTINDTGILGLLGGDADFDLSASSTARNTGKLGELAADKLEYDPEVLAREFVASRMQTIWQSDDMGKIFATMQEAHDAGEFEFTETQAAKSVGAVQRAAKEVEDSDGVQNIQKLINVDELSYDFGKEDIAKLDEDIKAQKAKVKDLEAQVKGAEDAQTIKPVSEEPAIQEKADVSWHKSIHPVGDGKIDDPSQRVIPKISEAGEDIRGANRPDGYGTPEYANKLSDDYTEEDWKYSARESLKRYEELVAQRSELEKNGWKDDIGRNFTEREAIVNEDGDVVGYGASGAENLDLSIAAAYNNYQDALSHLRGGGESTTATVNTPAVADGHEYRTKNVLDGYAKFIKDNLSDRRSNMKPVDKAANIALEQRIITPGGLADELNPGLRKGKKISPEAIVDGLDVKRLADNYYIGNASDVAEWPVWDNSNLFKLSNELLGTKFEDGVDYGYDAAKEAKNAIKEKLKEAIPRALENFGNKKLDNDVTLYRVISEGNEVNKGSISFLKKDSGEFKNSGISYLTLDEDAVLGHPNLTGSGKKYILRIKMPKGDNISAFDRSVLTQNYGDFGEEALVSSGHRAGGEFAANLDGYKFRHTGEFNKDGIEILDVYKKSENAEKQTSASVREARINNDLAAERQKLADLEQRKAAAASITAEGGEKTLAKELDDAVEADKKSVLETQRSFNKSAKKSNAAELISRNSGYSRRGVRVNPSKQLVGVNYMPGKPFGKWGSLVNDNYIKGNSIKMEFAGYKADGTPTTMAITAYNGGYKMYAEAGSFARNVVIDVRNGMSLWDAIYKQIYDNGFFIEPSNNQRVKYGALTVGEQAAKVTDKFMDRMLADKRFAHVFNDDGTVKSTDGLVAMLATRFRGQGINDFTKFLRKANWDSFTKAEQNWLNARAYEMTASTNKSTFKKIIDGFIKGSMALRYRSNMGWNLKNGQLQLTECQRAFTANKIGDFGATLKRLATDKEFRAEVSDRTYILAADSVGAGFSKSDLDKITDAYTQLASESVINKNGIITDIDKLKAKFKDFDDSLLGSVQGGEYAKNYILIAGFTAAGKRAGLSGAELDTYVRNRFNVEALAGTNVGKIGLTDSRIGQFTFMYLGFPIRELTLQAHLIKGGGTVGGKGFKKALGSLDYIAKMLGAKGAVWAMEAPWGYSLLDQIGIDPFGVIGQYDPIQTDWEDREPVWKWVDLIGVQYNPFLQGAMTSVASDIYMAYRAAEEEARAEYMKEHNGSTDGFEWSMFEDGGAEFQDIMKGLTPVGEQALGFIPGRTFYQRIEGELQDLDRGYRMSRTGNRMYEANTDPGSALWGMLTGRRNTPNAQDYYQTANPIRGAIEGGWAGLSQQIGRGFGSLNPFRGFREFDPADSETYTDWFDGSYSDQQNWNTGVYAFREEAQQIKNKYDKYITQGKELATQNSRENEFADLRERLEKFVKAYTDKHPEGISYSKQNQLVNIFNLGDYQPTVDEAVNEAEGDVDYTQWNAAQNRYAQGNFPTPYGLRQTKEGENVYGQSPQLQQVLSQQRYGIDSDVAPTISKMFKSQQFDTPLGRMTMKDYKDKVYAQFSPEYDKAKPDYKKINQLQEEYLKTLSKNVIQPILNTYGQSVLSAGKSSEIMQEFGRMLNGMIPSEEYRIDKKGKKIYQSTPYMSVDIKSWLNKNFKAYKSNVNTTNRATKDRIQSIRDSLGQGHTSTAMSKVRALIQDIGNGRASVSREELEWLQGVLND